jgi:hypothetical protein
MIVYDDMDPLDIDCSVSTEDIIRRNVPFATDLWPFNLALACSF